MKLNFNEIQQGLLGLGVNLTFGYDTPLATIVDKLIPFVFTVAGIVLLFLLISGGLQMMTSAGNPKNAEEAKGKITGALIGFVIIFSAYWIVKIVTVILNLDTGVI